MDDHAPAFEDMSLERRGGTTVGERSTPVKHETSKQLQRRQQRKAAERKNTAKRVLIIVVGAAAALGWAGVLMMR